MHEQAIRRLVQGTADQRWMVVIGVVFVLCWASGFVVPRVFVPYAEPLTFVAWRNAGAVLVLAGLSLGLGASWPRTAARGRRSIVGRCLPAGLCGDGPLLGGVLGTAGGHRRPGRWTATGLDSICSPACCWVRNCAPGSGWASAWASSASHLPCLRTLPRLRLVSC